MTLFFIFSLNYVKKKKSLDIYERPPVDHLSLISWINDHFCELNIKLHHLSIKIFKVPIVPNYWDSV